MCSRAKKKKLWREEQKNIKNRDLFDKIKEDCNNEQPLENKEENTEQ